MRKVREPGSDQGKTNWQDSEVEGSGRSLGSGTGFLKGTVHGGALRLLKKKTMKEIPGSWTKTADFPFWGP